MRRLVCVLAVALSAGVATLGAQVYRSQDGVTLPVPVKQVKPDYTAAAQEARIQGRVVLETVVQTDGSVGEVKVVQSLDAETGLDAQAVGAMRQWQFRPGTKEGKPVAVLVNVEMTFTLK